MFSLLFTHMIREEWRIHSTMFGNLGFALFPLMLTGFAFLASFTLPIFLALMPAAQLALIVHYLFVLLGVMVGSFGIMGREFMNRRFGQASLLAYSSRSLPVSERFIFSAFFIKDVVYYFFLWVLPAVAGFGFASPFLHISPLVPATLLISLTLSFLLGLSGIFFLSTLYARSPALLAATALIAGIVVMTTSGGLRTGMLEWLPSYLVFQGESGGVVVSMVCILLLSAVSVRYVTFDFPLSAKRYANAMRNIPVIFSFLPHPWLVTKDALDLMRSEGGMGKVIFSFLIPIGLIWVFLLVLIRFIPGIHPLIVFAVLLGVLSSTMYNWLTEFEAFTSYAFLPVEIQTVIRSKLTSYILLNLIPLATLAIAATTADWAAIIPAFAAFISVSAYALSVTVYLCGLYPNIMLYNARTFFLYLLMLTPVLLGLIFASVIHPPMVLLGCVCLPIAAFLLKRGLRKWTAWDMPHF